MKNTKSCACKFLNGEQVGWCAMHAKQREELAVLRQQTRDLSTDANRYRWLRKRDLGAISRGGVFAGLTPKNVVLNGDDLDREIDAAMSANAGNERTAD